MQIPGVRYLPGILLILMAGCATPATVHVELSPAEQILVDQQTTRDWPAAVERHLHLLRDPDVELGIGAYLGTLIRNKKELAGVPAGVLLYARDGASIPLSFSITGLRVYLSREVLQAIEHENELVAALAVECSHVIRRHAVRRAIPAQESSPILAAGNPPVLESRVDFFSPAGIFAYSLRDRLESVRDAVRLVYDSGHDPRGLVSYLRKIQNMSGGQDASALAQLEDAARDEMNRVPPLRNPRTTGLEFSKLRGRIRKL